MKNNYKTHSGVWPITRSCACYDLFLSGHGLQCGNCGAYTSDNGKTWIPVKWK